MKKGLKILQTKTFYDNYINIFLTENSKVNLISKNDEKYLWEKHIFDSISIAKFFEKYGEPTNILDIGTGGGFPSVPIAITYPNINIYAVDSIRKKINAVNNIKNELNITNLTPICDRVENINQKFDVVTSRAVASLDKICEYALQKLNKNGYFIAYKSKKTQEEIDNATKILKKYKAEIIDIIEYELPLEENFTRNLIIIKKN